MDAPGSIFAQGKARRSAVWLFQTSEPQRIVTSSRPTKSDPGPLGWVSGRRLRRCVACEWNDHSPRDAPCIHPPRRPTHSTAKVRQAASWLTAVLLGILLLLGQVGAQTHAVLHLAESHHDEHAPDAPACGDCLAYGHFGAAVPSAPMPWSDASAPMPAGSIERPDPHLFKPSYYFGRAPPVFSA